MPRILVVGSANMDLVTRVPRCPKPGETLIGRSFSTVPGGKGANQAVAAARLGARTSFVGCVGADAFGDIQRSNLAAEGIDVAYLKTHPDEATGTAVIMVADEGQNSIVVTPAANLGITPGDVAGLGDLFAEADAVVTQLEIPLETVGAVFEMARQYGVLSILDAGPAQVVPQSIVEKADIVSPNETEAEAMTGVAIKNVDDAREAAKRIMEMGARQVVLKMGGMGSLYLDENEWMHIPAFAVEPVDTTAAGDAFTAALAFAWNDRCVRDAILFANGTGALATTVAGAQPSMPTREQVEAFLAKQ